MNATGAFRVPTNGVKERYWAYPAVHRTSSMGVVLHDAVDEPGMFTVTHQGTGLALLQAVSRPVAKAFFNEIGEWPEWEHIGHKREAAFLRGRVLRARENSRSGKTQ